MINSRKKNCTWLMLSLFALLILSPVMALQNPWGRVVMSLLSTFILLGGIGVVSDSRAHLTWGILLMVPPAVTVWIAHTIPRAADILWLEPSFYPFPIYLFLSYLILKHIFRAGPTTGDHLHGAISLYLLLGLTWANGYVLIERTCPGSFRFADPIIEGANRSLYTEFIYYSYVTLTTLGYGDVTPVTYTARSASILEAICGVLFMGALVARIAGSFDRQTQNGA